MRDAQNRLGWLLSFRGAVTLEQRFGSARPLKFKLQAVADGGLDLIVPLRGGGGVKLPGPSPARCTSSSRPRPRATRAPR